MFKELTKISGPVIAIGLLSSMAWAADIKIGIVGTNEILASSAEGKRAQETIKRKGEELSKDLDRRRNELARQLEEAQQQGSAMKEDARKKKLEEFTKKEEEIRSKVSSSQQAMAQLEQKELKPIMEKLDRAIHQVARDGKYTLVLDKRVVIDFDPSYDISSKVKSAFGQ